MANKFIDNQEVLVILEKNSDYLTDEEAIAAIKSVYGKNYKVLSVDGGYVLYDGISKRVVIDGVSVDLDDIHSN